MPEAHYGRKETGISNSGEYSLVSAFLVATNSPIKQPLSSTAEKPQAKQPMGQEQSSSSQQTIGLKSYWTGQSQVMKLKVRFNNSQQIKIQDWWLHRWILSNIYRGINTCPSKIIPKNCRGRTTPKLILWGHHHPDTKPKDTTLTHTNYRPILLMNKDTKILKKNTSNSNSTIYVKDHTPWSSGIYSGDTRILQNPQINQWNTPH